MLGKVCCIGKWCELRSFNSQSLMFFDSYLLFGLFQYIALVLHKPMNILIKSIVIQTRFIHFMQFTIQKYVAFRWIWVTIRIVSKLWFQQKCFILHNEYLVTISIQMECNLCVLLHCWESNLHFSTFFSAYFSLEIL